LLFNPKLSLHEALGTSGGMSILRNNLILTKRTDNKL
jgi:hypothetical protein